MLDLNKPREPHTRLSELAPENDVPPHRSERHLLLFVGSLMYITGNNTVTITPEQATAFARHYDVVTATTPDGGITFQLIQRNKG